MDAVDLRLPPEAIGIRVNVRCAQFDRRSYLRSPLNASSSGTINAMATALIGLGSNVGDRRGTLLRAMELIDAQQEVEVKAISPWHATAPVGGPAGQGEFLNGALRLETSLSPQTLHELLRQVEQQLGRTRTVRWDQRTIDLDLLLYDTIVLETPELTI